MNAWPSQKPRRPPSSKKTNCNEAVWSRNRSKKSHIVIWRNSWGARTTSDGHRIKSMSRPTTSQWMSIVRLMNGSMIRWKSKSYLSKRQNKRNNKYRKSKTDWRGKRTMLAVYMSVTEAHQVSRRSKELKDWQGLIVINLESSTSCINTWISLVA